MLDGQNISYYAFTSLTLPGIPRPNNVTIRGLKIINYIPWFLSAAVDAVSIAAS